MKVDLTTYLLNNLRFLNCGFVRKKFVFKMKFIFFELFGVYIFSFLIVVERNTFFRTSLLHFIEQLIKTKKIISKM